ncbi:MAG: beta-1,6-N-acetylglucosaminyltransferase [Pseudomonadota bacterium]
MIGFVILAHADLHRTAALARFLAAQDCPVAIHVDANTSTPAFEALKAEVAGEPRIVFAERHACEWGRFSLVDATLSGVETIFARWPEVSHITLLSGSCLPVRPIKALQRLLARYPDTDFIEAVDIRRDGWVKDGLSDERFTLFHPFSWRRQRGLFDRAVELQRRYKVRRSMPDGLRPYLGSQWWTLSRWTLRYILEDPELERYKSFFRLVWIPDESFFQTLARKHSRRIVGRSLTTIEFDPLGKPYVFHSDHLELLMGARGYFARKIWPGADRLYTELLDPETWTPEPPRDRRPLQHALRRAANIRTMGRLGLIAQHRFPSPWHAEIPEAARSYYVFDGFDAVIPNFAERLGHLGAHVGFDMHGHLFAPDGVELNGKVAATDGNLTDNTAMRDYRPEQFLVNLLWNRRARSQGFQHRFGRRTAIDKRIQSDPDAQIFLVDNAWLLDAFRQSRTTSGQAAIQYTLALRDAERRGWSLFADNVKADREVLRIADLILEPERAAAACQRKLPPGLDIRALWREPPRLPDGFGAFLGELDAAGLVLDDRDRLEACLSLQGGAP